MFPRFANICTTMCGGRKSSGKTVSCSSRVWTLCCGFQCFLSLSLSLNINTLNDASSSSLLFTFTPFTASLKYLLGRFVFIANQPSLSLFRGCYYTDSGLRSCCCCFYWCGCWFVCLFVLMRLAFTLLEFVIGLIHRWHVWKIASFSSILSQIPNTNSLCQGRLFSV